MERVSFRTRFKIIRHLQMSPIDLERFGSALRDAFPRIRFIERHYERHWIENVYRDVPGSKHPELVSSTMRRPHGDPMPYLPSLAAGSASIVVGWVEPPNWQPEWSEQPLREECYLLLNPPELCFNLFRSHYHVLGPKGAWRVSSQPPALLADDERCYLSGGNLDGPYLFYEEEQKEFLRTVWRIMRRVTTRNLWSVDDNPLISGLRSTADTIRAGYDAAEWTRKDPRHLLGMPPHSFRASAPQTIPSRDA
jgi:hypothetical protein